MTRILVSVMTIALVAALIGGGIYAAFSDPETSTNNQFAAGTLDLTVDGENPWTSTKIAASDMKPGDSGVATCTLVNAGTLDGTFTVDIQNIVDDAGANLEPEGDNTGDLSANMDIVIWHDNGAGGGTANNGVQDGTELAFYTGKLSGATTGPWTVADNTLDASGTTYVSISYSIVGTVGNAIMDDSSTFDIVFTLNQA
jgi:spore coat-associated protein N